MADDEYHDYTRDPDGLLDYLTEWDDIDIEGALEKSQERQKERLTRDLERIEQQLDGREEIHEEIVDELEWKVEWYTDRLESLYTRQWGKPDEKRERLKNRIETFYRELREERQKHWRDKQELEQERRDLLRELAETDDDTLSNLLNRLW